MPRHTHIIQEFEVVVMRGVARSSQYIENFLWHSQGTGGEVISGRVDSGSHHRVKHYSARDHHKATEKAQDAGYHVVQAHKAQVDKIMPSVKNLKLLEPVGVKDTAIALGNIAFRRAKRIEDKNKYDKSLD